MITKLVCIFHSPFPPQGGGIDGHRMLSPKSERERGVPLVYIIVVIVVVPRILIKFDEI